MILYSLLLSMGDYNSGLRVQTMTTYKNKEFGFRVLLNFDKSLLR